MRAPPGLRTLRRPFEPDRVPLVALSHRDAAQARRASQRRSLCADAAGVPGPAAASAPDSGWRPRDGRDPVLVLHHDEQVVLTAVEMALKAGVPTKTHILNLLHRLIDGTALLMPSVNPPSAFTLTTEPQANVERYDALRRVKEARHA